MSEAGHSIVSTLRELKADGVAIEHQAAIVLREAVERLGYEGTADWLGRRLLHADRVIERVRRRSSAERIEALEKKVKELEAHT